MRLANIALAALLGGAAMAQNGPQPQAAPAPAQQPQAAQAQPAQQPFRPMGAQPRPLARPMAQPRPQRSPVERSLGGPAGKWWDRPELVQRLLLTADQQRKMDEVFQQARLRLIDLNATLEKETLIMEPLVAAEQPDEAKIVAQIDKVAQARAELEKANARMLLGIRRVLTQDQWSRLRSETNAAPIPAADRPAQMAPQGRGPQPPRQGGPQRNPPPRRP
jgi:periplasmic protein CpxP/Spy